MLLKFVLWYLSPFKKYLFNLDQLEYEIYELPLYFRKDLPYKKKHGSSSNVIKWNIIYDFFIVFIK
jgi:hypothetical protein